MDLQNEIKDLQRNAESLKFCLSYIQQYYWRDIAKGDGLASCTAYVSPVDSKEIKSLRFLGKANDETVQFIQMAASWEAGLLGSYDYSAPLYADIFKEAIEKSLERTESEIKRLTDIIDRQEFERLKQKFEK